MVGRAVLDQGRRPTLGGPALQDEHNSPGGRLHDAVTVGVPPEAFASHAQGVGYGASISTTGMLNR
jgi:hypothetical protein